MSAEIFKGFDLAYFLSWLDLESDSLLPPADMPADDPKLKVTFSSSSSRCSSVNSVCCDRKDKTQESIIECKDVISPRSSFLNFNRG